MLHALISAPQYGQECRTTAIGTDYQGQISVTNTGKVCQPFASQFRYLHNYTDPDMYPDASVKDTRNFCRNPNGDKSEPWCFTMDPLVEWEYCDVPMCTGNQ